MATEGPLARRTVALPETRMLDVLAGLLERRGAHIWRCPMVAIFDHPDEAAVVRWMQAFIADPPALTILLTGEGLRRLLGVAERRGLTQAFHEALAQQPFLVRGPKPARVLKELGLEPRWSAVTPTTAGVIETLHGLQLAGCSVGVQLYGENPTSRSSKPCARPAPRPDPWHPTCTPRNRTTTRWCPDPRTG